MQHILGISRSQMRFSTLENSVKVSNALGKIAQLKERKIDYEILEKTLQESGEP